MDGWSPKELSYLSLKTCGRVAAMLNLIEKRAPWPKSTEHARVVFLEKEGATPGRAMSYRPLTISAAIYRSWASLRLEDLNEWIKAWALPDMYAGVPGMGATDAWYDALTEIEKFKLEQTPHMEEGLLT